MVELEEFEPGRWRVRKPRHKKLRAKNMPLPFVISDHMPPTEQVDGRFYESKRAFRAVGKANGLIEVGTEKLTHKVVRQSSTRAATEGRHIAIKTALEKVRTASPS